jgi:hypothetical protein
MDTNKLTPYQHKLDFGEGPRCHEMYQKFLALTKMDDTPKLWDLFSKCWRLADDPRSKSQEASH